MCTPEAPASMNNFINFMVEEVPPKPASASAIMHG
jgi:hypothetical protein